MSKIFFKKKKILKGMPAGSSLNMIETNLIDGHNLPSLVGKGIVLAKILSEQIFMFRHAYCQLLTVRKILVKLCLTLRFLYDFKNVLDTL